MKHLRGSALCCAVLLLVILGLTTNESANEAFEHGLKQGGRIHGFHDFMQSSKGSTVVPVAEDLIVFVHIPRTSGETLKISLFNDLSYQFAPEWMDALHCGEGALLWRQMGFSWLCERYEDLGRNDEDFGPPEPWPVGSALLRQPRPWEAAEQVLGGGSVPASDDPKGWAGGSWTGKEGRTAAETLHAVQAGNVIQGFFSRSDIERLRTAISPRKLILWTVLRHPLERSLSFFNLVNSSSTDEGQDCRLRVPWAATCPDASYSHYYSSPPVVRTDVDPARRQHLSDYIESYGEEV